MPALKTFILLLFLSLSFALTASGQPPPAAPPGPPRAYRAPSLKTLDVTDPYYGPYELFSIALSKYPLERSYAESELTFSGKGSVTTWNYEEAKITLTIIAPDRTLVVKTEQDYENYVAGVKSSVRANAKAVITYTNRINAGGHPGVEMFLTLETGAKAISRSYVADGYQLVLISYLTGNDPGEEKLALDAMDTLKILTDADRAAEKARRIEAGTPQPLPQQPAPARAGNDAADERLKGKVKTVETRVEYPNAKNAGWSRSEVFYDESGNKLKSIDYTQQNDPGTITVYGYIDGARVLKMSFIHYWYQPEPPPAPLPAPAGPGVIPKPRDTRYQTKYVYSYDEKKRLKESVSYANDGRINSTVTYKYDGNMIEETTATPSGKNGYKETLTLDKKGNIVKKIFANIDSPIGAREYNYQYESFDKEGNWTKRIVTGKSGNYNGTFSDFNYIQYQTISYYP